MTSPQPPESASALDARYGRTPAANKRTRIILIGAGIAFAVVFALWLWWGGLLGAPAQFEAKDTGHTIIDDSSVTVTWQFTADPGTPAQCAVQAMNSTFAIVGWKVVDIPAAEAHTRSFSETLLTTERAVTGLIYRCWLT